MLFPVLLLLVFVQFNTIIPSEDRLTVTVEEANLIPITTFDSYSILFINMRDKARAIEAISANTTIDIGCT